MGNDDRLDSQPSNLKPLLIIDRMNSLKRPEPLMIEGARSHIDRNFELSRELGNAQNVIRMFMGNNQRVNIERR
jgi:hypothetical protein